MSDRKSHWENVYNKNSPLEVSWYQKEPVLSLQLIRNSRIALDAPIIDVGGGASVLVDYLCEAGYTNIEVLDIATCNKMKICKFLLISSRRLMCFVALLYQLKAFPQFRHQFFCIVLNDLEWGVFVIDIFPMGFSVGHFRIPGR